jgi:hypothetical protein
VTSRFRVHVPNQPELLYEVSSPELRTQVARALSGTLSGRFGSRVFAPHVCAVVRKNANAGSPNAHVGGSKGTRSLRLRPCAAVLCWAKPHKLARTVLL